MAIHTTSVIHRYHRKTADVSSNRIGITPYRSITPKPRVVEKRLRGEWLQKTCFSLSFMASCDKIAEVKRHFGEARRVHRRERRSSERLSHWPWPDGLQARSCLSAPRHTTGKR